MALPFLWFRKIQESGTGDGTMQYGIVIQPVATIYEIPAETMVKDGMPLSSIADEAMY